MAADGEDGTSVMTTHAWRERRGLRTKHSNSRHAGKNTTHCGHHCQIQAMTCAGVLEYLATGVPPSSIPSYANSGEEIEQVEEDIERAQRLLTTALAILLDSTSPGPDPLALSALGWAYGMGGGGGMGDWGGCHFMPGEIGAELRELEDRVAMKVKMEYYGTDYNVTLGTSDESSAKKVVPATRFCTVGALPPKKKPYAPGGALWQPPIAGMCVPSSCTNKNLLMLFGDDKFRDRLLRKAASITTSTDASTSLDGNTTLTSYNIPPAASRRYKYVSSLSLSITMGLNFRMGIQCAGETGLQELDESFLGEPFRSYGYKCTIALILCLILFVTIGTISSGGSKSEGEKKEKRLGSGGNHTPVSTTRSGVDEPTGSSLNPELGRQESNDCYDYGATIDENGTYGEDEVVAPLDNSCESDVKTGWTGDHQRNVIAVTKGKLVKWMEWSTTWIEHTFAPFNATQNFYEITRMSRDNPYEDKAQQEMMKREGESALDRVYSSTGLFPTYGADEGNGDNNAASESASSSHCLNGMRSISMFWIILGHTIVVQSSVGYQNPSAVLPPTGMISSVPAMFFFSARYAVDTFFFIAGYLVMSGLLKKLDPTVVWETKTEDSKKTTGVEQWLHDMKITNPFHVVIGKYAHRLRTIKKSQNAPPGVAKWMIPLLLHRILRILPTYGFVLLLWWKVAVTLGNGPFWPRWATFVAQCDKYAWTNMLFINNLVPWRQKLGETSECMYHAWYLGIDMQLCAVLTPLFVTLYLRRRCRKIVVMLEMMVIALIICASWINTYRLDWSGHLMDGKQTMNFDRDFYINPFYRATPYVVGFITAQIWHEKSRLCPNLGLRKSVSTILSIFSASLLIFLTFVGSSAYNNIPCMVWQDMHANECGSGWKMHYLALYNSFTRPAWSLGLAIMSLLGFNGQLHVLGGSRVLNWAGWDPVSKLSFGMYLLHPLVINVWFLSKTSKYSYSHVDFTFLCAAVITVTFLGALVVGVLVEWPMSKITKHFETWLWKGKMSSQNVSESSEKGDPNAGLSLHTLRTQLPSEKEALLSYQAG